MKISTFFLILFLYIFSGNLFAEIFYIDIDKIINQTNVGKHINKEFQNSKKILKSISSNSGSKVGSVVAKEAAVA